MSTAAEIDLLAKDKLVSFDRLSPNRSRTLPIAKPTSVESCVTWLL